jgi:hypothetical protein
MKIGMMRNHLRFRTLNRLRMGRGRVRASLPSLAERAPPCGDELIVAGKHVNRVADVPNWDFPRLNWIRAIVHATILAYRGYQ